MNRRRRRTRLVQNHPYYRLDERPMNEAFIFIRANREFGSLSGVFSQESPPRRHGRCHFDRPDRSTLASTLASRAEARIVDSMAEPRKVMRYTLDAALVFAPLAAMLYFLFDPAAFNAFLAWLVRVL
jgi:hypothetical protein